MVPGVDSASNRKDYQEYLLGGKGGRCLRLRTYHRAVPWSRNLGTLTSWNPLGLSSGPGSSVGIATDYGLDGPGSNPGGDEIFRPSRPALEPTQRPVK